MEMEPVPASRHILVTAPIELTVKPSLWGRFLAWVRRG